MGFNEMITMGGEPLCLRAVDGTTLLDGMVSLGAVLCALETGVMDVTVSFKWRRKWTVLLKLTVFGHFLWCELHLVSPLLKRSLVVGVRGFSRWGSLPRGRKSSKW